MRIWWSNWTLFRATFHSIVCSSILILQSCFPKSILESKWKKASTEKAFCQNFVILIATKSWSFYMNIAFGPTVVVMLSIDWIFLSLCFVPNLTIGSPPTLEMHWLETFFRNLIFFKTIFYFIFFFWPFHLLLIKCDCFEEPELDMNLTYIWIPHLFPKNHTFSPEFSKNRNKYHIFNFF